MVFYLLIIVSNSNMLICFTNIKAKKRPLGVVVERSFKILFLNVSNVRMVAFPNHLTGLMEFYQFQRDHVSPTDSTFQIGF